MRQSGFLPEILLSREVGGTMTGRKWSENKELEPRLSLEKAEEILRNVYRAAGAAPPEKCSEILRRGSEKTF